MNHTDKVEHDYNEDRKFFILKDEKFPDYINADEYYLLKHFIEALRLRLIDNRSSIGKAWMYAREETFSIINDLFDVYENSFKAWERGNELIEKEGDKNA